MLMHEYVAYEELVRCRKNDMLNCLCYGNCILISVQWRVTKLVHGIGHWHYEDRVKHLALTSLERIRREIIETYFYNIPSDIYFLCDGINKNYITNDLDLVW